MHDHPAQRGGKSQISWEWFRAFVIKGDKTTVLMTPQGEVRFTPMDKLKSGSEIKLVSSDDTLQRK